MGLKGFGLVKLIISDQLLYLAMCVYLLNFLLDCTPSNVLRSMIAICVCNMLELSLENDSVALIVLGGLANPALFCVLESRLLFNFKEEMKAKADPATDSGATEMTDMEFSEV